MTLTELLSAAFYLLTAVLLAYAVGRRYIVTGRLCAIGAILTVIAANSLLIVAYDGEPEVVYERPGPIKRARSGERGVFQFENDDKTSTDAAHGGSGAGGLGGQGADGEGSIVLASFNARTGSKAERQILNGLDCADCPDMVVLYPGVFRMGANPADEIATDAERPARLIGLAAPFAIGRNEVTIREFVAFAEATRRPVPACPDVRSADDERRPVTCVSARDADAYAAWLAARTGRSFRLPSESEWEYAARAGATGPYVTGSHLGRGQANIDNAGGHTMRVGSFAANDFGINDMHGNAAEIVAGCWVASPSEVPGDGKAVTSATGCAQRVLRDGHAGETAAMARLSARRPIDRNAHMPGVGFRLARDLD
ncbi:MAG: formylglycine-generating enzyme family protein [Hyphomicrobiaceae bacterium]